MRSWSAPELSALPGSGRPLRLYDTATGSVRPTSPGRTARMYVCGITPYDATHLGHAATFLAFDLVGRVWRDGGHQVDYVQNVTDVDDPLLERAEQTGENWTHLADREIDLFRTDMSALAMMPPRAYVGAVESISIIVPLIAELRSMGAAYAVDDDVYFSIKADPVFGEVAGLDTGTMLALSAGRGGDPGRPGKKDPLDPLLWRAARPGEPAWDSPLGAGRPGWHIECVAIALKYLGMGFDVQGGGSDLAFPHHEMGASHAHVLTGRAPYAQHYVHAGMVALAGQKMSKSLGNLVMVSQLRESGVDPMAIRLALLEHHYRTGLDWTHRRLTDAQERLARWRAAVRLAAGPNATALLERVRDRLADDLDAPAAVRAMDGWATAALAGHGDDPAAPTLAAQVSETLLGVQC